MLKINTVVSQLNHLESFAKFIEAANPERWKVFQVLKIEEVNGKDFEDFEIPK